MNCYCVLNLELELGVLSGRCNWSCEYDGGRKGRMGYDFDQCNKIWNSSLLTWIFIFSVRPKLKDDKVSNICVISILTV